MTNRKHFSLDDWDFQPGSKYFITADRFVTPPSSLCAPQETTELEFPYCYLKDTLAPNVSQGRFITYWYQDYNQHYFEIYLRQQPPLVHRGQQNGYVVQLDTLGGEWKIDKAIDGASSRRHTGPLPELINSQWNRVKLEWWEYLNPALDIVLRIELFVEVAGEWLSKGYWDDTSPAFGDSPTNRVGFAPWGDTITRRDYIDDTEIWEKAI